MILLALAVIGCVGLRVGSFLTVVVHRVPVGLSLAGSASACPHCGTRLRAGDRVPLVSWALLRGACRYCRRPIPFRYPLVETGTGVGFVLAALPFLPATPAGPRSMVAATLELPAYLYLAAISVCLVAIDIEVRRLPDAIVLPAYPVGVVLLGTVDLVRGDLAPAVLAGAGAVLSFLLYLALAIVKPGGMGLGDVKLAGVLGLFLGQAGVAALLVGTLAAFVLGGLFGAVLLLSRRSIRSAVMPFGPWMLAGAWTGLLFGEPVLAAYAGALG